MAKRTIPRLPLMFHRYDNDGFQLDPIENRIAPIPKRNSPFTIYIVKKPPACGKLGQRIKRFPYAFQRLLSGLQVVFGQKIINPP